MSTFPHFTNDFVHSIVLFTLLNRFLCCKIASANTKIGYGACQKFIANVQGHKSIDDLSSLRYVLTIVGSCVNWIDTMSKKIFFSKPLFC